MQQEVFEPVALVVSLAALAVRLAPRSGRRDALIESGVVLAAVWLTELVATRVGGLYQYPAGCVVAPLGVCLSVTALRSVVVASSLRLTRDHRGRSRAARTAGIVLVDATLLEVVGTSLGLWRWADASALWLVGPLGWAACAAGLSLARPGWRGLAPCAAAALASAAVVASWWAVLRLVPSTPPGATVATVVVLAGISVWLVLIVDGRTAPTTVPSPQARGAGGTARTLAAALVNGVVLAVVLLIPPLAPRASPIADVLADEERSIVLVGDVMLGRGVARDVRDGEGFDKYFAATRPLLHDADVAFGNLESVIASGGVQKDRGVALRAPPRAASALAHAGFDVVSLANNHIADFGGDAIDEERALLREAGVTPVGVGPPDAPQVPVIIERRGHTFGFLAYCDPRAPKGCTFRDRALPLAAYRATNAALAHDIRALRAQVDTVIVSLHWGVESRTEPQPGQVALGRHIIDLGADVVAGHHAHFHQRAERYRGGVIIYSMGNFVFDQHSRPQFMEAGLYRVVVAKDGVRRAAVLPVRYQKGQWVPTPTRDTMLEIGGKSRLQ